MKNSYIMLNAYNTLSGKKNFKSDAAHKFEIDRFEAQQKKFFLAFQF
jgi:hypothetical protein